MVLKLIKGKFVQLFERAKSEYANFKKQTLALTFPGIGPSGGAGFASKAVGGIKNIIQRATANPLGAGTVKAGLAGFGKRIAGRFLGGITAIEGFNLAYSGATGKPYSPAFSPEKLKSVAGFALSPFAGIAGLFAGGGVSAISTGVEKIKDFQNPIPPQLPISYNFEFPEFQTAGAPSYGGSPVGSFAPSISISGPSADISRGADLSSLALMLGIPLAVLLAYLGIKKSRKKKKSKKRKR